MRISVAAPYVVLFGLLSLRVTLESAHAKAPMGPQPPKYVEFDGQKLELAWQSETPEQPVAEFIPQGETLEKWTHLASIRQFPGIDDPRELASLTIEQVAEQYPGAPANLVADPKGSDAIIEFVVNAPDDSFAEYNVFKYGKDASGVVAAQQYALRGYGDRQKFLDEVNGRRQALLDEMAATGLKGAKVSQAGPDDANKAP